MKSPPRRPRLSFAIAILTLPVSGTGAAQVQKDRCLGACQASHFAEGQCRRRFAVWILKYLDEAGILGDLKPATTKFAAPTTSQSTSSMWPWLLGALALLAIGALAWNHWAGRHREVAEAPGQKTEKPAEVTGEAPYAGLLNKLHGIKVGDVDVGDLSTAAVNDLYTSLSGIKDEATAQAAVPGVTKASSEFDQLAGLFNQLPPDARKAVVDAFAAIKPNLDQLFDRVLGIPGVGAIIKPTVDAIRAKLDTLTTT